MNKGRYSVFGLNFGRSPRGLAAGLRRRPRLFSFVAAVAMVGAMIPAAPTALAVHDTGLFQLEGNAVTDAALPGDDWDRVCHQVTGSDCSTGSNTTAGGGASAVSWISEQDNPSASIFTGGGSKDPIDISSWRWKDGSVPDKDNLNHAFAARYSQPPSASCPAGSAPTCDVLYFGSDRFD